MKESLLCSVLVFLAETPKSAGRFKAEQNLARGTPMPSFIFHMQPHKPKLLGCTASNLFSTWKKTKEHSLRNYMLFQHSSLFGSCESNRSSVSLQADAQAALCMLCHRTNCLLFVIFPELHQQWLIPLWVRFVTASPPISNVKFNKLCTRFA